MYINDLSISVDYMNWTCGFSVRLSNDNFLGEAVDKTKKSILKENETEQKRIEYPVYKPYYSQSAG